MPIELHLYADGVVVRHDWSSPAEGERLRRFYKGDTWRNRFKRLLYAWFSFTDADWERLRQTNPALFESDPTRRGRAWMRFARSPDARFFRVI